jgi:hypothetical protein
MGVPARAWVSSKTDKETVFTKIEQALLLIKTFAPVRFARLQQDVGCIFVMGIDQALGVWREELRMCELESDYVVSADTSAADVASTIVHEAMHARLKRWGFGYEEQRRARIERVCFKAERAFARRLPDGELLVQQAQRQIVRTYDGTLWTNAASLERDFQTLRGLRWPEWAIRALVKISPRARAAYQAEQSRRSSQTEKPIKEATSLLNIPDPRARR